MPFSEYSPKQKKLARVAEPRDKITGADFEKLKNSKAGGGMIKYAEGGDIRMGQLQQLLSDARERGDDDMIAEIEAEIFQMGDSAPMDSSGKKYRYGGKVKGMMSGGDVKGRGCGAAMSGTKFSGTF